MYIGQSEKQRRQKMIAIFIAPFYIALNIYLFWRIKGWVQHISRNSKVRRAG